MESLPPEGGLETICNVTGNLTLYTYRNLADVPIELLRLFGNPGRCGAIGQHFDERDEMGRIERVPQNEPRRIFPSLLHLAEGETGSRRGHDRVRFQHRFDLREKSPLHLDTLWPALLNEVGVRDRFCCG